MPIALTRHAYDMVAERELDLAWIERAVAAPDWAEPDFSADGKLVAIEVLDASRTLAGGTVPAAAE